MRKPNPIFGPEHLKNSQPSTWLADFYAERERRQSQQLIDPDQLRRDRDWSRLANQVVGAESPPLP